MGDKLHLRSARWGPPWIAAALAWCVLLQQLTACGHSAAAEEPDASVRWPRTGTWVRWTTGFRKSIAAAGGRSGRRAVADRLAGGAAAGQRQAWDIAIAVRQLRIASAQLQDARVLWLPNLIGGVDYLHHDGPVVPSFRRRYRQQLQLALRRHGPAGDRGLDRRVVHALAGKVTCASSRPTCTAATNTLTSLAVAYFEVVEARAVAGRRRRRGGVEELVPRRNPWRRSWFRTWRWRGSGRFWLPRRKSARRPGSGWRVASAEVVRLARLKPAVLIASRWSHPSSN